MQVQPTKLLHLQPARLCIFAANKALNIDSQQGLLQMQPARLYAGVASIGCAFAARKVVHVCSQEGHMQPARLCPDQMNLHARGRVLQVERTRFFSSTAAYFSLFRCANSKASQVCSCAASKTL